jgi:acyl-coenzyme A thioesterase PaaI-like protein
MAQLKSLLSKAKSSAFYLWLLNTGLNRMIPFNKPHGFKILELQDYSIRTQLPYMKRNFNHIKGLHACALATLSEFTTGVLLISRLDPSEYRIILKKLDIEYHYQGKTHAEATYELSEEWFNENIYKPLAEKDAVLINCKVDIKNNEGTLLTSANVLWQIKNWSKVKTKS